MSRFFIIFATLIISLSISSLKAFADDTPIIPKPVSIEAKEGAFLLTKETVIKSGNKAMPSAAYLQAYIHNAVEVKLPITSDEPKNVISFVKTNGLGAEGYRLDVSTDAIVIAASTDTGWFYGVQSLIQMLPPSYAKAGAADKLNLSIPAVTINDKPRFSWRAFMLDEARFFHGKDVVKKLLDQMALLKMNVFHWHLTEDQGWRIEIKKYPLLTKIGSKRADSVGGPMGDFRSELRQGKPHSGFYTQEEIKEIVAYAAERHIMVVPEIGMPGHMTAAAAAYPWLSALKEDEITVRVPWGISNHVYNVADPRVVGFLKDVLDEVMDLFPSKIIHIGGDEARYDAWNNSPYVQAYMKKKGLPNAAALQVEFTNEISVYLQSKGHKMMGWNEIVGAQIHGWQNAEDQTSSVPLSKDAIVQFWKGSAELMIDAVEKGHKVVNSTHDLTYLDYNYQSIPLKKAYMFDPVPADLKPEHESKIIGTGTQMWSEFLPTTARLQEQVFPRIAAYATAGWSARGDRDFNRFMTKMHSMRSRWDALGINYSVDGIK